MTTAKSIETSTARVPPVLVRSLNLPLAVLFGLAPAWFFSCALVMRGISILAGVQLIDNFTWMLSYSAACSSPRASRCYWSPTPSPT